MLSLNFFKHCQKLLNPLFQPCCPHLLSSSCVAYLSQQCEVLLMFSPGSVLVPQVSPSNSDHWGQELIWMLSKILPCHPDHKFLASIFRVLQKSSTVWLSCCLHSITGWIKCLYVKQWTVSLKCLIFYQDFVLITFGLPNKIWVNLHPFFSKQIKTTCHFEQLPRHLSPCLGLVYYSTQYKCFTWFQVLHPASETMKCRKCKEQDTQDGGCIAHVLLIQVCSHKNCWP